MKELSIEEKAKAYDEALEKCKAYIKNTEKRWSVEFCKATENVFFEIFPELKKSEDEKIRKEIMDFIDTNTIDSDERRNRWFSYLEKYKPISFTSLEDTKVKMSLIQYISELNQDVVHLHPGIETCNTWIAWLEKQGTSYTKRDVDNAYIEGMALAKYELEKQGEKLTLPKWKYKKDHTPLLRDSIILNKYGCVAKSPSGAIVSDVWVLNYDELAKLPKEELEKQGEQKQKPTNEDMKEALHAEYEKGRADAFAQMQKEWRSEDSFILKSAIALLKHPVLIEKNEDIKNRVIQWLKSLIPQSKQKWSEEDEKILKEIISDVKFEGYNNDMQANSYKKINWLKSLIPKKHWKPSDEQMEALYEETQKSDRIRDVRIVSLYNDLKKLKEE